MQRTWGFEPLPAALDRAEIDPGPLRSSHEELLRFYQVMQRTRTFEERLARLYRQGTMFGAVSVAAPRRATRVR